MKDVSITFDILEEGGQPSPIYSYMPCHMIFYFNMEFNKKDCYVATGCHAPKYDESSYTLVVPREIICIAFTYAALNGVYIMEYGIQNSYLAAPCSEIIGPDVALKLDQNTRIRITLLFDPTI